MGKFKKGDVIRAKRDINGFFDEGANYRIAKKIGQNFVLTDNDEPELEDAKHHTDLSWLIENFELVTLKIEAGKFYKTRDGRKVGPAFISGNIATFGSASNYASAVWSDDGRSSSREDKLSLKDNDIVAEWIGEPVAKPSNDNAKPKFKVGDIVKRSNGFMPHQRLRITKVEGERYSVEWLVGGPGSIDTWRGYEFELVTPAPTTTTIVALIENGQPKPSSTPHVHTSAEAAEKEAKRLSSKFKGKQFGVFTLTKTHEEAAPVYDHKWQNMAALGLKIDAIKELRAVAGLDLLSAKRAVEAFEQAA
ncbi:MAG TPA: hypothetical protein DHE23_01780 [Agrobacterium sp.]|nr:hypothetical protein [Agrobacterium sp.]